MMMIRKFSFHTHYEIKAAFPALAFCWADQVKARSFRKCGPRHGRRRRRRRWAVKESFTRDELRFLGGGGEHREAMARIWV